MFSSLSKESKYKKYTYTRKRIVFWGVGIDSSFVLLRRMVAFPPNVVTHFAVVMKARKIHSFISWQFFYEVNLDGDESDREQFSACRSRRMMVMVGGWLGDVEEGNGCTHMLPNDKCYCSVQLLWRLFMKHYDPSHLRECRLGTGNNWRFKHI